MSDQSDTPDTPPEVLARQSASRALTPQTAELIGSREYQDESGKMVGAGQARAQSEQHRKVHVLAEKYMGGTPHMGLSAEQVSTIKNRSYPDAPTMDKELGDRTPAFVNWLWANKPKDAKVRYGYRNIWPTSLPAEWPPKAPSTLKDAKSKLKAKPATATPVTA